MSPVVRNRVVVVYATRHGHCARIADRMVDSLRARTVEAERVDAAKLPAGFRLNGYAGAMLISPIHLGRHLSEMARFVKANLDSLQSMPAAFLSVSLSQAGAEMWPANPERRALAAADASRVIDAFLAETGWHPLSIRAVAGALLYTKYNFLLRLVMKRIASRQGGATDVRQDHEYTDWPALDSFCGEFVHQLDGANAARTVAGDRGHSGVAAGSRSRV